MSGKGLGADRGPIVLAFSGGLDTSYCVPWLAETYGRPVVTVTVDTGGLDDAAAAELDRRARQLGAVDHLRVDARRAYFERVLRFLVAGNVRRGGVYPLCVGAERALQAQEVARAATRLGSGTVAHGCTAAGNDQVRFEVALRALAPELEVLAPIRDQPKSRAEEAAYLAERGFAVPPSGAAYSINRGLWGTTIGGRETLGSSEPLAEEAWVLTRSAFAVRLPASSHRIGFLRGVPTSFDGEALEPVALVERLEAVAAPFGIGRGIHLGDTVLGIKGRVAFEAPAAEVLLTAHRELEKLVLTGRQQRLKEAVAAFYGDWVHEGHHLDPACRDAEALLASSQERVTGEVRVLFRPGSCFVEGVTSPFSLMAASRGTYGEAAKEWTSADAAGFARLLAVPGALYERAGRQAEEAARAVEASAAAAPDAVSAAATGEPR